MSIIPLLLYNCIKNIYTTLKTSTNIYSEIGTFYEVCVSAICTEIFRFVLYLFYRNEEEEHVSTALRINEYNLRLAQR